MKNDDALARTGETDADRESSRTAPTVAPTAYTPGPWQVTVTASFDDNSSRIVTGVWVEAGPYHSIASVMPVEAVRGNAYLIAAAPDLLAALKALRARDKNDGESCGIAKCGHCDTEIGWPVSMEMPICNDCLVDRAIAKAEGHP
jgi:hypothetical protein